MHCFHMLLDSNIPNLILKSTNIELTNVDHYINSIDLQRQSHEQLQKNSNK